MNVFAEWVRIVSHLSRRTSAILEYFCPLWWVRKYLQLYTKKFAYMYLWLRFNLTLAKVSNPCKKPPPDISLRASPQDGFTHGLSGSCWTGSTLFWKSNSTQSIILMMRWGGLASFLTIKINHNSGKTLFKKNIIFFLFSPWIQINGYIFGISLQKHL